MHFRERVLGVFTALILCYPSVAAARKCQGIALPDVTTVDGNKLRLNGMGIREATILEVDVFVAGLYLEKPSRDGRQVIRSEQRKQLRMVFVRDVDRAEMSEAIQRGFERSDADQTRSVQAEIDQFKSALPTFASGDEMIITYRPQVGIAIAVKSKDKANEKERVIPGVDFARALFGIWVGNAPPNEGLKVGLLGGACE